MNQELIGYVCVALFTIGIMLLFCIDIFKRSYTLIQLNAMETAKAKPEVEVDTPIHDNQLAYPFYVEYIHSRDTDQLSNTEDTASLNFQPVTNKQPFMDNSKIS